MNTVEKQIVGDFKGRQAGVAIATFDFLLGKVKNPPSAEVADKVARDAASQVGRVLAQGEAKATVGKRNKDGQATLKEVATVKKVNMNFGASLCWCCAQDVATLEAACNVEVEVTLPKPLKTYLEEVAAGLEKKEVVAA